MKNKQTNTTKFKCREAFIWRDWPDYMTISQPWKSKP